MLLLVLPTLWVAMVRAGTISTTCARSLGARVILIARNATIARKQFKICMEVVKFLGFKTSIHKVCEPVESNVVLGLELCCKESAIKCGKKRAAEILGQLQQLDEDPLKFPLADLDQLTGRLGFLSYHKVAARQYLIPLYALRWATPAKRVEFLRQVPASAFALRLRTCIQWWRNLLSGSRVLWAANEEPLRWMCLNSDAASPQYGSYDSFGNFSMGLFKDHGLDDEIIAFKELFTVAEHLRRFTPDKRTGIYLWCDNMNVVHTINRGYAKKNQSLLCEFARFHEMCELNALRVVAAYCNTKDNLATDLMSRSRGRLAYRMLHWMGVSPKAVKLSKSMVHHLGN